jgi:membrane-associated phospholipid phosphatase
VSLSALDRWTLGYLAFAAVMIATSGAPRTPLLLAGHALVAAIAIAGPALRTRGGAAAFIGAFYPLIAAVFLYTAVGLANTARGVAHDAAVQAWEQRLFGAQPSRDWIRAAPWPWLSWLLHAGYLSYYLILAGAPLVPWLSGRRDGARRVTLAMTVSFYVCYAVFLVFPVAGPRYAFPRADNAATATAIARGVQRLLDNGAAWGTAFPSSHVAVSLTAAGAVLREWRGPGIVLMAAALVLTLGTVYGQFHYAVDALAGALAAGIVLAAAAQLR